MSTNLVCAPCFSSPQVESTVVEQLGVARKVTIAGNSTTLIADSASKDEIEMRVAQASTGWHAASVTWRALMRRGAPEM